MKKALSNAFAILGSLVLLFVVSCSNSKEKQLPSQEQLVLFQSSITQFAPDHHAVRVETIVNASAEAVWSTLMDFETMPQWSGSLQKITPESPGLADGQKVIVTYIVNDNAYEVPHTLIYEEGKQFGWSDPFSRFPQISDHHLYQVEPIDANTSRFIQSDAFQGTDPNITTEAIVSSVLESYQAFNQDLKNHIEK